MKDSEIWLLCSAVAFICGFACEYVVHERLCATLLMVMAGLALWISYMAGKREMVENMKVGK